jgi:DNA repair protein RecO (recombination protein O)
MDIIKTQGITLRSIPYKERQRIVNIFTRENGVISLIVKGLSQKNTSLLAFSSSFCLSEIIYIKKRSDLYILKDFSIIDDNLSLREDFSFINSAYLIVKAILDSQLHHKKAVSLYELLKSYLKKIPIFKSHDSLITSFLLKILIYEGLINIKSTCNLCYEEAVVIQKGESLCSSHANSFSHKFSKNEFINMQNLSTIRSFSDLEIIDTTLELKEKIILLFKDLV